VDGFDPLTNTWAPFAPMTTPGFPSAVTGGDGRIYTFKLDASCPTISCGASEVYNPVTNAWAPITNPHVNWHLDGGAFAAGPGPAGKIFGIGGARVLEQPDDVCLVGLWLFCTGSRVDAYDPATNTWTRVADMSIGRARFAATTGPDGLIYAIGGIAGNLPVFPEPFDFSDRVDAYNPSTNTWTSRAPMPTPRRDLSAVTLNGKIFAIGGETKLNSAHQAPIRDTDIVEVYDPVTNSWSTGNCMITPRHWLGAATAEGRIFTVGGTPFSPGADGSTIVEALTP
jgi:hypothetical protein